MSRRIIVSGNKEYGLAKALDKVFEADFYSRTQNDFDFGIESCRKEFAKISLKYDIFICCSSLSQFRQILLLEEVYKTWLLEKHKGTIICIGSTADNKISPSERLYPIEKHALRAACLNLALRNIGLSSMPSPGIKVTYVGPGPLNTPSMESKQPTWLKIDTDYVAGIVKWLLEQPASINFNELTFDPIQN